MRIVIDNSGYDLLNLGDIAMLQVAVRRMQRLFPGSVITVITEAPDRLAALCPGTRPLSPDGRRIWARDRNIFGPLHRVWPGDALSRIENDLRTRWPSATRKWISRRLTSRGQDTAAMHTFLDEIASADLVLCAGGGFMTDAFAPHALDMLHTLDLAANSGVPAALVGQGIGPIRDRQLLYKAKRVLTRVRLVALRERLVGPALLASWGVDPVRVAVTGDDAIELAYGDRNSAVGTRIGVNVRLASYAEFPPAALAAVRDAIAAAAATLQAPLVAVPISFYDEGQDLAAARTLIGNTPPAVPLDDAPATPDQLASLVSTCRVVVTGSYHAAVFALSQGIPVVALVQSDYYQHKFAGVADLFGLGCTILRLDRPGLAAALSDAVTAAWNTADAIRAPLLLAARAQIDAGMSAYARLAEMMISAPRRRRNTRKAAQA